MLQKRTSESGFRLSFGIEVLSVFQRETSRDGMGFDLRWSTCCCFREGHPG